MPVFQYRAQDPRTNSIIEGTIDALSDITAQNALEEKGLITISIAERKVENILDKSITLLHHVPAREVVVFSRELAVMIEGGVPIVRSLRLIGEQIKRPHFQKIIQDIAEEVNSGVRFSKSLEKHASVFDPFFVNMVRSGETTGKLDEVLVYLADQKEKDYTIMGRVKGALAYPAFIVVGLIVVGFIMVVYVLPKLTQILSDSGQALPWSTNLLIGVTNFFSHYWVFVVVFIIGSAVALRWWYHTKIGKEKIDFLILKIPIFGKMFEKVYLTRFARSFSTLLKSGVPVTQALTIAGDIVGNEFYKAVIEQTKINVSAGNSIAAVFQSKPGIPPMIGQMMRVGEETGRLDKILAKLADFYAREVDVAITTLVNLIEPIIILILGVAVAIFISAILLPLYNLSAAF